jgi:Tfp pilus assembly protein PilF
MGQVFMAKGDMVTASNYFNRSIKSAPDQPDSYLNLGYLYLFQDNRDQAYHHLVTAMNLDPGGSIGMQAQRLLDLYFP